MNTCSVIFGPRTRLGIELARTLPDRLSPRILVARDDRDEDSLTGIDPGALIARNDQPVKHQLSGFERVEVYMCALGPIHPGDEAFDAHAESTARDLLVVEQLLTNVPRARLHLVFVSSILARVGPVPSRSYYAGFKNVVEGRLSRLIAAHDRALMSVVHPGRLTTSRSVRRPTSLLQTTYQRLARRLIRIGSRDRSLRVAVGLDARLFTLARSAVESWQAIVAH
ncbi:MAG: hypothetical protein AB7I19_08120 [Planctomycetota bacterium]